MGDSFQPEWRKKSSLQDSGKGASLGINERNNSSMSSGFSAVVQKNSFELSFPTLDPKAPIEPRVKQSVWSGADRSSSSENSESDPSKVKAVPKQSKFTMMYQSMPNLKLARELEKQQQQQPRTPTESSSEKRLTTTTAPPEPKPIVGGTKSSNSSLPPKPFDIKIMKKASSDTLSNASRQEFLRNLKKTVAAATSPIPTKVDTAPSVPIDETKETSNSKEAQASISPELSTSSGPSPISIGSAEPTPQPNVDNLSVHPAEPKEEKKEKNESTSSSSERDGVPKLKPNWSPKMVLMDRSAPFPSEVKNFKEGDENRLLQQLGWSPEDDNDIADEASSKVAAV